MGAPKWAKEMMYNDLQSRVLAYYEAKSHGQERKRNDDIRAFLNGILHDFEASPVFSVQLKEMDLPGLGTGGSDKERRTAFVKVRYMPVPMHR